MSTTSSKQIKRAVLAYSGGLDTSIIIPWLRENYGCEVIAMVGNVGQGDDYVAVRKKALASGATKVFVEDLREEFVTGYLWKAVKTGTIYEGKYLLGTSLARPLLAKTQVEIALREGADALAHGCTGKGNDQVRFELAYQALAPHLHVIAPWREWSIKSREDALQYAESHNIPVSATKADLYSRDQNLWHLSHEGGPLETQLGEPPDDAWKLTTHPAKAPEHEGKVVIGFEAGVPVAVNGRRMGPVKLVETLNEIGGRYGVGRTDLVENRLVGIKSHGAYETPGGSLIYAAHQEMESLCLDRETLHFKQHVALRYAELTYYGLWFTPLREALDSFVDTTQQNVTGKITLGLYRGNIRVLDRESPYSLYDASIGSFVMSADYNQVDAKGFINILGLPLRLQAALNKKREAKPARRKKG
jgi:argininosuccinate synthase